MAQALGTQDYDDVVVHRKLSFDLDGDSIPRYWFCNDPWLTHWMNAVFGNVPVGERFVMKATRKQLEKISDPAIRRAAISFIKQEGSHANAHEALNAVVESQGVPIQKSQFLIAKIFKSYEDYMPDVMKFAFAATGEHFTATLSTTMLENPELWDQTPDQVAALAFWHFVEEIEHKSVSFDIYKNTTGDSAYSYVVLMATLALGISTLATALHASWLYLIWKDGQITNVRSALKAARRMLLKPGVFRRTFLSQTLPFLSPKFHPWDHDNREMINAWKNAYEQSGDPIQAYHAFRDWHAQRQAEQTLTSLAA